MDAVTSTTATSASSTAAATATAQPDSSDYQVYLEMLTVQVQNQDPLDPMDADDFAVQLATFSMVERQAYTNALLETQLGVMGEATLAQMSAWVGQEVRGSFPVNYTGDDVEVYMPYAVYGDTHELVVVDADGEEVKRIPVEASGEVVIWDGTDADGQPVEDGLYAFRIDSFEGEELVGSGEVETYALVNEVRMTSDGVRLVTSGDVEIDPNLVSALRTPDDGPEDVATTSSGESTASGTDDESLSG